MPAESPGPKQHQTSLLQPLIWPFQSSGEFERLIWLLVVDYIPVINLIVMRGWRLAVVRRMAYGERPLTPHFRDIGQFFTRGLLLWFVFFLYGLVPLALISWLGVGGIIDYIQDAQEIVRIIFGQSSYTLAEFISNEIREWLIAAAIGLAWAPIGAPLYRASMIRYAVTGSPRSLFNVPAAATFLFSHAGAFIKLFFFSFVMSIVMVVMSSVLIGSGFGILALPVVTIPVYYWSTAYEYGEVAERLVHERARKAAEAEERAKGRARNPSSSDPGTAYPG